MLLEKWIPFILKIWFINTFLLLVFFLSISHNFFFILSHWSLSQGEWENHCFLDVFTFSLLEYCTMVFKQKDCCFDSGQEVGTNSGEIHPVFIGGIMYSSFCKWCSCVMRGTRCVVLPAGWEGPAVYSTCRMRGTSCEVASIRMRGTSCVVLLAGWEGPAVYFFQQDKRDQLCSFACRIRGTTCVVLCSSICRMRGTSWVVLPAGWEGPAV